MKNLYDNNPTLKKITSQKKHATTRLCQKLKTIRNQNKIYIIYHPTICKSTHTKVKTKKHSKKKDRSLRGNNNLRINQIVVKVQT